jgi:hypothetical protein
MTQPNNAFQPTPLRGPKIAGILESDFVLTPVPIYTGGAAECWPLGGAPSSTVVRITRFCLQMKLRCYSILHTSLD